MAEVADIKSAETKTEMTAQELALEVSRLADVNPQSLPNTFLFVDPGNSQWTHGKPPPLPSYAKTLSIFAMFHDDANVRVYCAPVVKEVPYTRFVISKQARSLVAETMLLDIFKESVADELRIANGDAHGAELERDSIVEYLKTLPGDYPLSEAIEDIDAEVHNEAVDDEGEVDGAPPAAAPPVNIDYLAATGGATPPATSQ